MIGDAIVTTLGTEVINLRRSPIDLGSDDALKIRVFDRVIRGKEHIAVITSTHRCIGVKRILTVFGQIEKWHQGLAIYVNGHRRIRLGG